MRGRVRPGKASSLLGMVVGIGFVIFGLVLVGGGGFGGFGGFGGAPPAFGAFSLIWLLAAVGITGFHAYNYFSDRGASTMEWDIELPEGSERALGAAPDGMAAQGDGGDFDARLRKLEGLRDDGLISDDEYARKRAEILAEKW